LIGDKAKSPPPPAQPQLPLLPQPPTPPPSDATTVDADVNCLESNKVLRHILQVRIPNTEGPVEMPQVETQMSVAETLTKSAKINNDTPFWFTNEYDPSILKIPLIDNPLFNKKARVSRFEYGWGFF